MPDTKITALTAITTVNPATSPLVIVDLTDTTMAASGTTKKVTANQILGSGGTATLSSATITGGLTVQSNVNAPANVSLRYGPSGATWAGLRFDATNQTFLDSDIALSFRTGGATSFTTAYTIGATGISTWYVGGSTAMTLNATGLGVGTSPNQKFVCAGPRSYFAGGGAVYGIGIGFNTTRTAADHVFFLGATDSATPDLVFSGASGAALMRLDAAGNVGIGVTPSALNSSYKGIQVGGSTFLFNNTTGASNSFFYTNAFQDSANNTVYRANGRSSGYLQLNGEHRWYYDSGTQVAGANCAFTQAMTLDASGNLILLSSNTPATLGTNGQLTMNATSNTNLRFSYRGSDGITRVANLTLA